MKIKNYTTSHGTERFVFKQKDISENPNLSKFMESVCCWGNYDHIYTDENGNINISFEIKKDIVEYVENILIYRFELDLYI